MNNNIKVWFLFIKKYGPVRPNVSFKVNELFQTSFGAEQASPAYKFLASNP